MNEHGADDAYFLSVSFRKVANILTRSHDFIAHQRHECFETVRQSVAVDAIYLSDEVEKLLRRVEVDEESLVDERASVCFP